MSAPYHNRETNEHVVDALSPWRAICDEPGSMTVERIALESPAEYRRLLESFYLLIGDARPWWRVSANGTHKAWPSAVKAAITEMAISAQMPAKQLATWLDTDDFPKGRARALKIANRNFERGIR